MVRISRRAKEIGEKIAIIMPVVARKVLMEFFQENDITQSQVLTILAIFEEGTCRASVLSQKLEVSAPTMTGIVDRLQKGGYALREHDERDRRVVNVSLTSKGEKLALRFRASVSQKWAGLLTEIPPQDREHFLRITVNLRKKLK